MLYLGGKPKLFGEVFHSPKVQVVFSDTRKRYTEFHRLSVTDSTDRRSCKFLWVRIVKNKPAIEIRSALENQTTIMQKFLDYSSVLDLENPRLSCCRPLALLPEHRALVTWECSGRLFNDYLRCQVPFLNRESLSAVCYNVGAWLQVFHQCFRMIEQDTGLFNERMGKFCERYGKYPSEKLQYLTCCHNDFSPRNIFVDRKSVEVIDFVGVEVGFPQEDIEFFNRYIMEARFNLLYPDFIKKMMLEAFHSGYESVARKTHGSDCRYTKGTVNDH